MTLWASFHSVFCFTCPGSCRRYCTPFIRTMICLGGLPYLDISSRDGLSRVSRAARAAFSTGCASSFSLSACALAALTFASIVAASFYLTVAFAFSSLVTLFFSLRPTSICSTSYFALFASIFWTSSCFFRTLTSSSVLISVALPVSNLLMRALMKAVFSYRSFRYSEMSSRKDLGVV